MAAKKYRDIGGVFNYGRGGKPGQFFCRLARSSVPKSVVGTDSSLAVRGHAVDARGIKA